MLNKSKKIINKFESINEIVELKESNFSHKGNKKDNKKIKKDTKKGKVKTKLRTLWIRRKKRKTKLVL